MSGDKEGGETDATEGPQQIYANYTGVGGGAFDMNLVFGYQPGEPGAPPEMLVRVAMSWEHAQAIVKLMQEAVDKYQEQVGPLPDTEKIRQIEQAAQEEEVTDER
jgi:hypothetical protein